MCIRDSLITKDQDKELKAQRALSENLISKDGLKGRDRFVRDLILACYYAHKMMKEIDERFPGDPRMMLKWMRSQLHENNRNIVDQLKVQVPSVENFILDYAVEDLIVKRSRTGTYGVEGVSMKGYIFDSGEDDWYYVPKDTLQIYAKRNNCKTGTLLERWGKSGRLFNFAINRNRTNWWGRLDQPLVVDGKKLNPTIVKIHKGHDFSEKVVESNVAKINKKSNAV